MATWVKTLHIIGWFLLVIMIIILIAWQRLPSLLSQKLSSDLNVPITIEKVYADHSKISIEGLVIYNLPDSHLPFAFKAHMIEIYAPFFGYFANDITIDKIFIDEVYLGLEFDTITSEKGNWTRLMGQLGSEDVTHSILIKELILKDIATQVYYRDHGENVIDIPQIQELVFEDISSKGGFPTKQVMNTVLGQMLLEVFKRENLKNMISNVISLPLQPIRFILFPFKKIFGGKKEKETPPEETTTQKEPVEEREEESLPEEPPIQNPSTDEPIESMQKEQEEEVIEERQEEEAIKEENIDSLSDESTELMQENQEEKSPDMAILQKEPPIDEDYIERAG